MKRSFFAKAVATGLAIMTSISMLSGCTPKDDTTNKSSVNTAPSDGTSSMQELTNKDKVYTMAAGFSRPADFNGNFFQFKIGTPMNLIYEGLFTLVRTTDTIIPKLCDTYTNEGSKTTIKMKQNAKWSDGKPFTSKDIKAYFDINNGHNLLKYLDSVEYPDDYTVILNWCEPVLNDDMKMLFIADGWHGVTAYHVYQKYADDSAKIIDEAIKNKKEGERGEGPYGVTFTKEQQDKLAEIWNAFVGSGPKVPIGTGPYMIDTYTDTDMILVKNPYFYDADKVEIEKVIMKNMDNNTALALMSSGGIDHYPGALPVDITDNILAQNKNMVFYPMFDPASQGLFFNTSKAPFDSLELRQAITMVLDKKPIREAANIYSKEDPKISSIGIVPSTMEEAVSADVIAKLKDYTTNQVAAEKLLTDAGWSKNDKGKWQDKNKKAYEWNIVVGPNSGIGMLNGAMVISDQLNKFGFTTTVTNSEPASFYEKSSKQEHDMLIDFTDVSWSFVNPYSALNHYYTADPAKWAGLWKDGGDKKLTLKDWDGKEFEVYGLLKEMTSMNEADFQSAVDRIVWATNESAYCVNLYQQTTGVWENRSTTKNLPLDAENATNNFMRLPESFEEREAVALLNLGFAAGGTKFIGGIQPK